MTNKRRFERLAAAAVILLATALPRAADGVSQFEQKSGHKLPPNFLTCANAKALGDDGFVREIRRRSPRRTVTNAVLAMLGVPSRDPALPLWTLVCDRYYIRRNDPCSTLSYWGCLRRRQCHRQAHQT